MSGEVGLVGPVGPAGPLGPDGLPDFEQLTIKKIIARRMMRIMARSAAGMRIVVGFGAFGCALDLALLEVGAEVEA